MSAMPRKRKQNLIEDVRLHDLRHTGTYAGQSGANAFLVRDLGQCLAAQRRRSARARQPRCFAPILLQKSFCIVDYKIPGPQARFSRKHVGGHISHRFSGVLAQIAAIAACTPRTTLKRTALRALAHAGIVALAGAGVVFLTREASPQTSIETAPNASALTAAILVPRGSERPSFDCAKAKTAAARLICADAELARLDSGLGAAFRKRKAQLSVADQSAFVADELAWIKDRNTRCGLAGKDGAAIEVLATSKPCVTNAIRERIAYLVQIHTTTGPETAPSEFRRQLTNRMISNSLPSVRKPSGARNARLSAVGQRILTHSSPNASNESGSHGSPGSLFLKKRNRPSRPECKGGLMSRHATPDRKTAQLAYPSRFKRVSAN